MSVRLSNRDQIELNKFEKINWFPANESFKQYISS